MSAYQILPFRFSRFDTERYLLTNEVGEYIFLPNNVFRDFIYGELSVDSESFRNIASKQIATIDNVDDVVNMLATKYRTKKSVLENFTTLHMVVPTLRCNSSCIYCQVKRLERGARSADMDKKTAKNIVRTIFKSPSPCIKIEFQGGDPSTYFEMVKYIIESAEWQNLFAKRELEFVICTNITLLNEDMVRYLKKHKCYISTSLDGPKWLHNANRPLQDKNIDDHALFEKNLNMIREIWEDDECVSALMTTSRYSLGHFKEIIDEYIRLGFHNIFLRALNPYGFAKEYKDKISYPMEDFVENFKEGLDYIIEVNKKGIFFVEGYSALLLRRMLTPFATGFVDLQSPAGAGISGAIYDYDGSVYVADEGRMLARFKNYFFRIGNVNENTYQEIFNGEKLHEIINSACNECLPVCAECVFQPYCGADPVRNLSEQRDMVGHRPTNEMCKKNKAIFHYLFELIDRHDPETDRVLWSWINN